MAVAVPPLPRPLPKQGPTPATVHMVELILRKAETPLSLNQIKLRLPNKVMHQTLRAVLEHYKRLGCVSEGSKGVMWTLNTNPEVWKRVRTLEEI